jgi:hypothetical protein
MLDLADVLKNNLLLRYYSTDNQFIQKYPGTFPGRFTRLNKIGERGYEPPPPPEPGSNQIDIKTGQPIGIGVKQIRLPRFPFPMVRATASCKIRHLP